MTIESSNLCEGYRGQVISNDLPQLSSLKYNKASITLRQYVNTHMEDMLIQFYSGNIAGWSLVSTGMPLDLLKTKLQLNRDLSIQYFKREFQLHGGFFKTFYRGASSMYLFIGIATALEFTVFETFFQIMNSFNIPKEAQLMSSGMIAGMASSMIYTPIQFAKIRTQLDTKAQKMGSAKRMFHILKKYKLSGLRKIYTGLHYTMLKQGPGLGMYFGGFHVCMMDLFKQKDRQNASLKSQIGSAFIAGLIYNIWGYPFDTFKTNVQSGKATVKSLIEQKFWRQKNFKQGLGICVMRGLIVDSTNLTVYERVKNMTMKFVRKELH